MQSLSTLTNSREKIKTWWQTNSLFALSLFLLIFIPLYPKLPLAELIPGYLVRVRLEDILVGLTGLVWLWQLLREKLNWRTSYNLILLAYVGAGVVSLLVALFLQQTIPLQALHLGKSLLHYLRYLEYFSLFLFMLAGLKTQRQLKVAMFALVISLNLIFIYGWGQRHWQWPAFSTMNREFSKGASLVLAPEIKLHSTFGGHYDLAAYLVIVLPILAAWLVKANKRWLKAWLGLSLLAGFWLLLESASKTALAGCLLALAAVTWFYLSQRWGRLKASLASLLVGLVVGGSSLFLLWQFRPMTLYRFLPFLQPESVTVPIGVEGQLDETWSENARRYGLSMGIRLDTLWPNALRSFGLNPYTGRGYATINKQGFYSFTEADSTDNNFLRILGETGLLGFVSFFGLIYLIIKRLLSFYRQLPEQSLVRPLTVGFVAGTGGLLVNALIIDVFAASKVAFTYWALAGLSLKSLWLEKPKIFERLEEQDWQKILLWLKKHWPLLLSLAALILVIHQRLFTEYSLVKSFALAPKQAKYVAFNQCLVEEASWSSCLGRYQLGPGLLYSFYLLPFYWLFRDPTVYYWANLLLMALTANFLIKLVTSLTKKRLNQFLILLIIFVTPAFFRLPAMSDPVNLFLPPILWLLNKWWRPTLSQRRLTVYVLSLLAVAHLAILQYLGGLGQYVLKSWRDTHRPANYVSIRRANWFFETLDTENTPVLLTAVEPVLFDLYGEGRYQVEPLSLDEIEANQLLIEAPGENVYVTNANAEQDPNVAEVFAQYQKRFGISLKEIECRHSCNYYQLLAKEIEIPTQPITWNGQPLSVELQSLSNDDFLVLPDEILVELTGRASPELTAIKLTLQNKEPQLIFLVGNAKEDRWKNYGRQFQLQLQALGLDLPLVYVPGNYSPRTHQALGPGHQRFAVEESWFVTLDSLGHARNAQQKRFLFDTLLQLEQHPEVKTVYFISQNDQWLQPGIDNVYFAEDFPRILEKFEGVEFKFIEPLSLETLVKKTLVENEAEAETVP